MTIARKEKRISRSGNFGSLEWNSLSLIAQTGELNVNGCSYVPDTLFNRVSGVRRHYHPDVFNDMSYLCLVFLQAACDIHDLCYITPGATKEGCDRTFVENIILIYW